jgi:hypothetical protein
MRATLLALVAAVALGACEGSDPAPAGPSRPDATIVAGTPQQPPMGQPSVEAWLAEGHYLGWRCESNIFSARLNGAHGRHRICSNQALLTSTTGNYPVGAASVKELFYGANDQPNGFAVGVKVLPGIGPGTWYWYERVGRLATLRANADSIGDRTCGACHALAPRDNVFIRAE